VKNKDQKIWIKYNLNVGLIIISLTDMQNAAKVMPNVRILKQRSQTLV
jgi:hypothetical protein